MWEDWRGICFLANIISLGLREVKNKKKRKKGRQWDREWEKGRALQRGERHFQQR